MKKIRVIARLDIKDNYVVKGRQLEGVRRVGNPNELAYRYYKEGIDEIVYIDNVASLYNRNSLEDVLFETTKNIFIPVTVGGGIRTVENARYLLSKGADKIAINTEAIKDEKILTAIADEFGSQCMVLSIQAKKNNKSWEALFDNGREHSRKDAIDWAIRGEELGAGEILVTSVDKDGMMQGIDYELIDTISKNVSIPVVYSGGVRNGKDLMQAADSGASGVAIASVIHYNKTTIKELKQELQENGGEVRIN